MLTLPASVRGHLAAEPADLRRGHDGLVAIVRNDWKMNPYEGLQARPERSRSAALIASREQAFAT